MTRPRRKLVKVEVVLSVDPSLTAAQARTELRSRVNNLSEYWDWPENAIRLRKAKGVK